MTRDERAIPPGQRAWLADWQARPRQPGLNDSDLALVHAIASLTPKQVSDWEDHRHDDRRIT